MLARISGSLLALSLTALAASPVRSEMLVSTDWLAGKLKDPNVVILHVGRERAVYDKGHIPGARWLAYDDLLVSRGAVPNELPPVETLKAVFERAGVSDGSRVILYTDDMVLPATRCYFTLDYLGHGGHASLLDGGLRKWRAEGRPLSADAPAAASGKLTVKPRPELVAAMTAVAKPDASVTLVDARDVGEYAKGHIPGAVNLLWGQTQVSREDSALKPADAIRKMYEAAGVKPGTTAIAYCNTGVQATQSYFVLKYLGYDVKLYDGSMSEWTAAGQPVAK